MARACRAATLFARDRKPYPDWWTSPDPLIAETSFASSSLSIRLFFRGLAGFAARSRVESSRLVATGGGGDFLPARS